MQTLVDWYRDGVDAAPQAAAAEHVSGLYPSQAHLPVFAGGTGATAIAGQRLQAAQEANSSVRSLRPRRRSSPSGFRERNASPNTIAAYRYAIRLLLRFAATRCGREPSILDSLISIPTPSPRSPIISRPTAATAPAPATLAWPRSIRSDRYAALRHPEHAHDIQRVLSIPPKRTDRALVTFLDEQEIDALLAAPDRATWTGLRDHALLLLATPDRAARLRADQARHRRRSTRRRRPCDLRRQRTKQRITPLTCTTGAVIRVWLTERAGDPNDLLFPTIRGRRLSRDALE